MNDEINYAEQLQKDLEVLFSNKLNSEESKIYFSGFLYTLILNKKMFHKNEELKDFLYEVFLKPFNIEQYRDYLYKSRTLLGSRVSRHIIEHFTYSETIAATKMVSKYIIQKYNLDSNGKSSKNKPSKNIADELSKWINNEK